MLMVRFGSVVFGVDSVGCSCARIFLIICLLSEKLRFNAFNLWFLISLDKKTQINKIYSLKVENLRA